MSFWRPLDTTSELLVPYYINSFLVGLYPICLEIMSIFVGLRGIHVCLRHLKLGSNVHLLHFYKIDELEKNNLERQKYNLKN